MTNPRPGGHEILEEALGGYLPTCVVVTDGVPDLFVCLEHTSRAGQVNRLDQAYRRPRFKDISQQTRLDEPSKPAAAHRFRNRGLGFLQQGGELCTQDRFVVADDLSG